MRSFQYVTLKAVLTAFLFLCILVVYAYSEDADTSTPIKHLVVIYQENVSFDHYFGTYPKAENLPGEPVFKALRSTPTVNGLSETILKHNANSAAPVRLSRREEMTCDQRHDYRDEQLAYNAGLLNKFVEFTGSKHYGCDPRQVMGYYDGNTITALWNYAQHYAMSDNFFATTFGPSTPGALNLISGQTHGASPENLSHTGSVSVINGTVIDDPQPGFDDCSSRDSVEMSGRNIGDLLNSKGITWGWFQGGFKPSIVVGKAVCDSAHTNAMGKTIMDYVPHHEPFQFYRHTANPHHMPPLSISKIGITDQANHQYDLSDFWEALKAGSTPAVSFLKAPAYEDGHAGYSGPLAEQKFLVETINRLQSSSIWENTAIVIAYDDSDGWYDHVMPPLVNQSNIKDLDSVTGAGCGVASPGDYQGRCGYGPRLPLLIISPYAKKNFIDHSITDQTSILRFIEDNWKLGRIGDRSLDERAGTLLDMFDFSGKRRLKLILDPETGLLVR